MSSTAARPSPASTAPRLRSARPLSMAPNPIAARYVPVTSPQASSGSTQYHARRRPLAVSQASSAVKVMPMVSKW